MSTKHCNGRFKHKLGFLRASKKVLSDINNLFSSAMKAEAKGNLKSALSKSNLCG